MYSSVDWSSGSLLGSGGDDLRLLVWRLEPALLQPGYQPTVLEAEHRSSSHCCSAHYTVL